MKKVIFFLIAPLILTSCQEDYKINQGSVSVTEFQVISSELYLVGTGLDQISSVTASGSNLTDYTFKVTSQGDRFLSLKALHPFGNALNLSPGQSYQLQLQNGSKAHSVSLTIPSLPSGMIVAFETACPTGWTQHANSRGRMLLGAGSGNADSFGNLLTSRLLASVGGLEYTSGIGASSMGARIDIPGPNTVLGVPKLDPFGIDVDHLGYIAATPDTSLAGDSEDSNLPPFATVVNCTKN